MDSVSKIYTDGGIRNESCAAATIVINEQGYKRKVVALISEDKSSSAEAIAAILGFAVLNSIRSHDKSMIVNWYTDCLTLIHNNEDLRELNNKQTNPLREILLSRLQEILPDSQIRPTHVKAHKGHRENEQCDRACRWICDEGHKLLNKFGEGPIGKVMTISQNNAWILLDLRMKDKNFDALYSTIVEKLNFHLQ